MKKAASVFLRAQIMEQDVDALIQWLENPMVTRYLNEESCAAGELRSLLRTVPEPLYGMRLSRDGRFSIVCGEDGDAVGFVRLARCGAAGEHEIVFVVGKTQLCGDGPLYRYVLTDRMMFDALCTGSAFFALHAPPGRCIRCIIGEREKKREGPDHEHQKRTEHQKPADLRHS